MCQFTRGGVYNIDSPYDLSYKINIASWELLWIVAALAFIYKGVKEHLQIYLNSQCI